MWSAATVAELDVVWMCGGEPGEVMSEAVAFVF